MAHAVQSNTRLWIHPSNPRTALTTAQEDGLRTSSNPLTEYSPQMELGSGQAAFQDESAPGVFDEAQELELAASLLEVLNEDQLDHFLVKLLHEAGNVAGSVLKPAHAQALREVLRKAIDQILPFARKEHGAPTQRPFGAQLGSGLSSAAGKALGLELEGLSPEDGEFEAVKQFVRFAGETVKKTVEDLSGGNPRDAVRRAAAEAAEVYAPGLFADAPEVPGDSGRWIWCRDRIILFGV